MARHLRNVPVALRLAALVALAAAISALAEGTRRGTHRRWVAVPRGAGVPAAGIHAAATPPVREPPSPAEPVEEALAAARAGDLDRYLDQFAAPLRSEMGRLRQEKGDAYLRDYLSRFVAPLKGVAVHLSERREVEPGVVRCPVEFVYADRNEVQSYVMRREGDRWRITRIETPRPLPTLVPYGTPVDAIR